MQNRLSHDRPDKVYAHETLCIDWQCQTQDGLFHAVPDLRVIRIVTRFLEDPFLPARFAGRKLSV